MGAKKPLELRITTTFSSRDKKTHDHTCQKYPDSFHQLLRNASISQENKFIYFSGIFSPLKTCRDRPPYAATRAPHISLSLCYCRCFNYFHAVFRRTRRQVFSSAGVLGRATALACCACRCRACTAANGSDKFCHSSTVREKGGETRHEIRIRAVRSVHAGRVRCCCSPEVHPLHCVGRADGENGAPEHRMCNGRAISNDKSVCPILDMSTCPREGTATAHSHLKEGRERTLATSAHAHTVSLAPFSYVCCPLGPWDMGDGS